MAIRLQALITHRKARTSRSVSARSVAFLAKPVSCTSPCSASTLVWRRVKAHPHVPLA
jgi:hypothetical protein